MSLDSFFDEKSEEVARSLYESENRYARLFNLPVGPAWNELDEEQQAVRVLALRSAAERGLVIIGA